MLVADAHLARTALEGPEEECGDAGLALCDAGSCFVALVDGLGHGPAAAQAAQAALDHLRAAPREDLVALMQGLHAHLKGTRGAVAFLARLDLATGRLDHCGVGNISAKVFDGDDFASLSSRDGIVGYMMAEPRSASRTLAPGDLLLLASDGVRTHFDLFEHPGLLRGQASDVAGKVLAALSKGDDDASCLVLRVAR